MNNVLVLGIGNALLTDEGVGIRAIHELERRYLFPDNVELMDGGTAGIELLRHINGRSHLIIIDALKNGKEPGTMVRLDGEEVPAVFRTRISPHQLGLSDLLAAAMLTDELPENLVLFGMEPNSLETGLELSGPVEASLDKLLTAVIDELRRIDCEITMVDTIFSDKANFWDPEFRRSTNGQL